LQVTSSAFMRHFAQRPSWPPMSPSGCGGKQVALNGYICRKNVRGPRRVLWVGTSPHPEPRLTSLVWSPGLAQQRPAGLEVQLGLLVSACNLSVSCWRSDRWSPSVIQSKNVIGRRTEALSGQVEHFLDKRVWCQVSRSPLAVTQIAAPFVITAHAVEAARCDQECKLGSANRTKPAI
jgi:hypothetical protein